LAEGLGMRTFLDASCGKKFFVLKMTICAPSEALEIRPGLHDAKSHYTEKLGDFRSLQKLASCEERGLSLGL